MLALTEDVNLRKTVEIRYCIEFSAIILLVILCVFKLIEHCLEMARNFPPYVERQLYPEQGATRYLEKVVHVHQTTRRHNPIRQ
jgi:hypothetical protein